MKHLQRIKLFFLVLTLSVLVTNCSKDEMDSKNDLTGITVKLKSTVGTYDKVYIDIEDVQFRVKEDIHASNAWLSLDIINQGTYNANDLREDSELLLVNNSEIESTYIYEIRLILGDNNFMDINGVLMSLDVTELGDARPSNIVGTELITNRFYDFIIDLDIDESISFNEVQNMMVFNPKIYTAIRQNQY